MKKIFNFILIGVIILASSTSFAFGRIENSNAILAEMRSNSNNFIRYGGQSIGISFFLAKNSISVVKYQPPQYIISIRNITHYTGANSEVIEGDDIIRYSYDYNNRKMYIELQDRETSNINWVYIDPKIIGTHAGYKQNWDSYMAAGEIAFYLAYNMSFFDEPLTYVFKNYIQGKRTYYEKIY